MKIYVGLSGGVDSSVAAALLQRDGHDVTGVYMKNWTQDLPGIKCPWKTDLQDARAVAARLDIPFKVFDFQQEYRQQVVDYMIEEYRAGRTPNPDIMCNQEIKFKLFLDAALADGAEAIATGHYARVENGRLLTAVDANKDQTYFLYRVDGAALAKSLMPIGDYQKPRVRELAAEFGLPTATKKDSQGICFVGPVGVKAFLKQYVATEPGPILLGSTEIGQHDGAIFYTIGQRQGLGVGGGRPFYVIGKDMDANTIFVTDDPADLKLHSDQVRLEDAHWIGDVPRPGERYQVRFRHRGQLLACVYDGDTLRLDQPAHSLAVGQSAVLYDGEAVLGGAVMAAATLTAPRL